MKLALDSFGFNLSKKAMRLLLRRYSMNGRIAFDSFVALCIRIKALSGMYIVQWFKEFFDYVAKQSWKV